MPPRSRLTTRPCDELCPEDEVARTDPGFDLRYELCGGTFAEGVGFDATITFADTPVQIMLPPTQGASMTEPLSATLR